MKTDRQTDGQIDGHGYYYYTLFILYIILYYFYTLAEGIIILSRSL